MGSDSCPEPEIAAAIEAADLFGDEILLVGPQELLNPRLKTASGETAKVRVIHAPDIITMEDKGLKLALKAKRAESKTSMAVAMDLLKSGEGDAFVTAGNTGGALATAYYRLGILEGVERPALTASFPSRDGFTVILDIGANPECKPEHLVQFAVMGSVYAEKIRHVSNPRIGLISNGEESGKGNELVKETSPLLEQCGLNFIGNVEPKEVFGSGVDVAVTDGFTGNILMKTSEAVAGLMTSVLKRELTSSMITKTGALLAKPAFKNLKKLMDPEEIGAAPLLGINGLVFVGHGRSNSRGSGECNPSCTPSSGKQSS